MAWVVSTLRNGQCADFLNTHGLVSPQSGVFRRDLPSTIREAPWRIGQDCLISALNGSQGICGRYYRIVDNFHTSPKHNDGRISIEFTIFQRGQLCPFQKILRYLGTRTFVGTPRRIRIPIPEVEIPAIHGHPLLGCAIRESFLPRRWQHIPNIPRTIRKPPGPKFVIIHAS